MDIPPTPSGAGAELDWRLAGLEERLDAISERVERIESAVRGAVAEEVQAATADLRKVLNELGRRLVKDLPHELARHRDTIVRQVVGELRPLLPPEPEPIEPAEPAEAAEPATAVEPAEAVETAVGLAAGQPDDPEPAAVAAAPPDAAEQRRRASRLRRRHG